MPFSKVLLVKPSGRSGLSFLMDQIPLGLEYIAAYIENVVDAVYIVDMEMEHRSFQQLLDLYSPDLVGITMSATEHNEGLHLAKIAKKRGIATMVGGYHPTGVPESMLSHPQVDMVVRGEGEVTARELIERNGPEDILGVSYKKNGRTVHNENRPLIKDLDRLPFPARHLRQYSYWAQDRKTDYDVILTSRGCYGRCTFCCEPNMSRGHFRCRSPENVLEEILEIERVHDGRPVIVFIADPNFMGKPARVESICELLQEHDLHMQFIALVRTDHMARHPGTVKKMCKAGILYFEMGIESTNPRDLKSTKKGITTKIHREAVRNIRKYGGSAGGTFVIGLPDQTEEEIRNFPVYAREIGMTGAAFGVVTPFPGTEFYQKLDKEGLIFETDWTKFDEMHSVFMTKHLSKEKIEELATYCMAKFWNVDTFIDREKVTQRRTRKKTPLANFVVERANDMQFIGNAGKSLKKDTFGQYARIFLETYPDPRVEEYTRRVGVHNVLEMSRFLRILGPQTIQCTLNLDDVSSVSFVIETTEKSVDYIRIMRGKQNHSTIDFDVDMEWINNGGQVSKMEIMKGFVSHNMGLERLWSTFRLLVAVGTEFLVWKIKTEGNKIVNGG
jgi:radical SAM superfamily enzyme YgiQ (UPF0313 family)